MGQGGAAQMSDQRRLSWKGTAGALLLILLVAPAAGPGAAGAEPSPFPAAGAGVQAPPPPPSTTAVIFYDGFEYGSQGGSPTASPFNGWSNYYVAGAGGSDSDWEHGAPSQLAPYAGLYVWKTGIYASYPTFGPKSYALESPSISTLGYSSIQLDYFQWYQFEDTVTRYDCGLIEASADGGPWTAVTPVGGYPGICDGLSSNPLYGRSAFTNHAAAWAQKTFDLSAYDDIANLRIRFLMGIDDATGSIGWAVDDLTVSGALGGRPSVPTPESPWDFQKGGEWADALRPEIVFSSTDPDGQDIRYQLQVDDDPSFATPSIDATTGSAPGFEDLTSPADTDPFASGDRVRYTAQSDLVSGSTYWWRVRATDPGGSASWSGWSGSRSLTIDGAATSATWFQTTQGQFARDSHAGSGPTGSGGGAISTGFGFTNPGYESVIGGEWTYDYSTSPSGASFVNGGRVADTAAGWPTEGAQSYKIASGTVSRALTIGEWAQVSQTLDLTGMTSVTFDLRAVVTSGSSSAFVYRVMIDDTTECFSQAQTIGENAVHLNRMTTCAMPAGPHKVSFRLEATLTSANAGVRTIWIDNVRPAYSAAGTATGTPILYSDGPTDRSGWDEVAWSGTTPGTSSLSVAVQRYTGSVWDWTGIAGSGASGTLSLGPLGVEPQIRLVTNLTESGGRAELLDWEVKWLTCLGPAPCNTGLALAGPAGALADGGPHFAGLNSTFTASVADPQGAANMDRVELRLDGTSSYQVTWTEFNDSFWPSGGGQHFDLLSTSSDSTMTGVRWTLDFKIRFHWDLPWADTTVDPALFSVDDNANSNSTAFPARRYTVDNDLAFGGALTVYRGAVCSGTLVPSGGWIGGGMQMHWCGARVGYESNTNVAPADGDFDVRLADDDGDVWNQTAGAPLALDSTADAANDPSDNHTLAIVNVPGGGPHGSTLFELRVDAESPNGTISYPGGFTMSTSVSITHSETDTGGSALSTWRIQRRQATLAAGACGAFSNFTLLVTDPPSPYVDSTLASGNCFEYRLRLVDTGGLVTLITIASTVMVDNQAPTGSISYTDGWYSALSVSITHAETDPGGSGIFQWKIQRRSAVLSAGACGGFGAWADLATNVSSPYADTSVLSANCYQYLLLVTDRVGLTGNATSASTARVDAVAPAATIAYVDGYYMTPIVNMTHTESDTGGSGLAGWRIQRRSATLSGGVCGGYTGWGDVALTPASPWSDTNVSAGNCFQYQLVASDSAGNNGIGSSASTAKVVSGGPVGTVSYTDGYYRTLSVSITHTENDTSGSGIAWHKIQRRAAALAAGACGAFGAWADLVQNATSPYVDASVADANCYQYQLIVTNNIGITITANSASTAKVDVTGPTSTMPALPKYHKTDPIALSWNGSDAASGVSSYDIAVSEDGAAPVVWLANATNTTADYWARDSHSYCFFSHAWDRAGNREAKTTPDACTKFDGTAPVTRARTLPAYYGSRDVLVEASVLDASPVNLTVHWRSGGGQWQSSGPFPGFNGTVTVPADGKYEFYTTGTDDAGNSEAKAPAMEAETTVDTSPPGASLSVLTPIVAGLKAKVKAHADDAVGLKRIVVEYTLSSGAPNWQVAVDQPLVGPPSFDSDLDVVVPADGEYLVRLTAHDLAGTMTTVEGGKFTADATPPQFSSDPPHNARDVPMPAAFRLNFTEPMNRSALDAAFSVAGGQVRDAAWTSDKEVTLTVHGLEGNKSYTLLVKGVLADVAGNKIAETRITFTTIPTKGTLAGVVRERGGGVIKDATVRIALGNQTLETKSGRNGDFRFSEVPAGTWSLHVEARGYVALDGTVDVAAGETRNALVELDRDLIPYGIGGAIAAGVLLGLLLLVLTLRKPKCKACEKRSPPKSEMCAHCGAPLKAPRPVHRPGGTHPGPRGAPARFGPEMGLAPAAGPPRAASKCNACGASVPAGEEWCPKCGQSTHAQESHGPPCANCGGQIVAGYCTTCYTPAEPEEDETVQRPTLPPPSAKRASGPPPGPHTPPKSMPTAPPPGPSARAAPPASPPPRGMPPAGLLVERPEPPTSPASPGPRPIVKREGFQSVPTAAPERSAPLSMPAPPAPAGPGLIFCKSCGTKASLEDRWCNVCGDPIPGS